MTVRNLFGNLPVRVKQRAVVAAHRPEHDRLWDILKMEVTGVMLSWRSHLSLKIRDGDGRTSLSFNTARNADSPQSRSAELQRMLNVLTQANYISIDAWSSWVPVSASTSTITVRGAISLEPAPSKRVQFISFGIRPLFADAGHNELYNEVNRIFALSSFGTIEDDIDVPDNEKTRCQRDKRFNSDGYTNRQLKTRKGVDRYPMFHLRISLKEDHDAKRTEDQFIEVESNLQTVLEVLTAMVTQWLSAHHFRTRKPRSRHARLNTASTSGSHEAVEGTSGLKSQALVNHAALRAEGVAFDSPASASASLESRKRKGTGPAVAETISERSQHRPFAEWSRIKSARADFFDNASTRLKARDGEPSGLPLTNPVDATPMSTGSAGPSDEFDLPPIMPGSLNAAVHLQDHNGNGDYSLDDDKYDKSITWTDPSTNQNFLLNARTGCVLPQLPARPSTEPSISRLPSTLSEFNKPMRLQPKPVTAGGETDSWLKGILQSWDNPVFKPVEKRIREVTLHEHHSGCGDHKNGNRFDYSHNRLDKALGNPAELNVSRLSKAELKGAQVLAQLDKKFILVKMRNSTEVGYEGGSRAEILALIDQHAADERIRVEALLAEFCAPLPQAYNDSGYRSKLGHQSNVAFTILEKPMQFTISSQEHAYFSAHAPRFAAWGILLDLYPPKTFVTRSGTSERQQAVLSVATLPPAVSERCKADPQLLISLLRSAVWKYVDDPLLESLRNDASTRSADEESPLWVRRLSTCPEGLIDLVNSRACRSAIMFNDDLSLEQCEELVAKLSRCVFPFMCAHGRPSMVPLVDLGTAGVVWNSPFDSNTCESRQHAENGFVYAWKQWRRR